MSDPLSRHPAGVLVGRVGEGLVYALEDPSAKDMQLRQYAPFEAEVERSAELDGALAKGAQAFLELGRRLVELRDQRVGRVYDVVEDEGRAFWVVAAPGGPSLQDLLADGKLKPVEVARLAADAAQGLGALHLMGLLHRDVAPETLVRSADGGWMLVGWSTDRRPLMKPAGRQEGLFRPSYSAPEMQDGSLRQALTEASDVYALCATLHHAMAGEAPAGWMERMKGAPSLAGLKPEPYPAALLELIDKGMAARPGERFATVDAWWEQARPLFEGLDKPAVAAAPEAPVIALPAVIAPAAPAPSLPAVVPAKAPPAVPGVKGLFGGAALKGWLLAAGGIAAALAGVGFLGWLLVQPHKTTYYAERTAVVRAGPDAHADEIERQPRGTRFAGMVQPTQSGTPWLKIDMGSGKLGYVSTKSLGLKPPPVLDETAQGPRRLTRDSTAHEAPDAGSPSADSLNQGETVKVVGRTTGGWYELLRPSGGVEYLSGDAFAPVETASTAPPAASSQSAAPAAPPPASPGRAAFTPITSAPPRPAVARPSLAPDLPPPVPRVAAPTEIRSVAIIRKPSPADIQRAYPRAALARNEAGSALVDCAVGLDGAMRECKAVGANPIGEGFEEAARQLGALYVVKAVDQDGQATAGRRITFEIKFQPQ
jgi:serine/threonine protein kinase